MMWKMGEGLKVGMIWKMGEELEVGMMWRMRRTGGGNDVEKGED